MQISRHWRMNAQRYRLEGVRYDTGDVSLQPRPVAVEEKSEATHKVVADAREQLKPAVTAQVA